MNEVGLCMECMNIYAVKCNVYQSVVFISDLLISSNRKETIYRKMMERSYTKKEFHPTLKLNRMSEVR